jgi:ABC-type glycerol-3-phosphate transport system substrate-binding protein
MWGSKQASEVSRVGEKLVTKAQAQPLDHSDWQALKQAARGDMDAYKLADEYVSKIGRASDRRRYGR